MFSAEVDDWYSITPSEHYNKQVIEITAKVFIEATEFGDVLALLTTVVEINVTTGVEQPDEFSPNADSNCG